MFNQNGGGRDEGGNCRGIQKIATSIDDLRNPNTGGNLCRGEGRVVPVDMNINVDTLVHKVSLALSISAQHIGVCKLEVFDNDVGISSSVNIATGNNCARSGEIFDEKLSASSVCPSDIPMGLVTNDMCLHEWTFNLDKGALDELYNSCKNCVLRWTWVSTHVEPFEYFETCIDVNLKFTSNSNTPSGASGANVGNTPSGASGANVGNTPSGASGANVGNSGDASGVNVGNSGGASGANVGKQWWRKWRKCR